MIALTWIASALLVAGTMGLINKQSWGWFVRAAGSALWIAWAVQEQVGALIAVNGFFLALDLYGGMDWLEKD